MATRTTARGLKIGRLFGIELRVDPSWLLIFLLISWSLTGLFSAWHPNWHVGTSVAVAVTSALVFFGSVLVHELAHCLVALAYQIPVTDVTLHLFGGVSSIEREPPTPLAEFLMAIVGPIASIGLGTIMMVASSLMISVHMPNGEPASVILSRLGPVETLLVWLGPVNILVGLFNMLPGFPLDGGRVLRSLVWKVTGNFDLATRVAGGMGQFVGFAMIFAGVLMVLGYRIPYFGTGISGLWLAMIGLFLRNAAAMHMQGAVIDRELSHLTTRDLMRTQGLSVDENMPLRELVDQWFLRRDELAYPVFCQGAFRGLVSMDDLRKLRLAVWEDHLIKEVMTPASELVTSFPREPLREALRKLAISGVQQLPVLDDGVLVGMLYGRDIGRWLQLRTEVLGDVSEAPKAPLRPAFASSDR